MRSKTSPLAWPCSAKAHGSMTIISSTDKSVASPNARNNSSASAISSMPTVASIVPKGVNVNSLSARLKPASTRLPTSISVVISTPPIETTISSLSRLFKVKNPFSSALTVIALFGKKLPSLSLNKRLLLITTRPVTSMISICMFCNVWLTPSDAAMVN